MIANWQEILRPGEGRSVVAQEDAEFEGLADRCLDKFCGTYEDMLKMTDQLPVLLQALKLAAVAGGQAREAQGHQARQQHQGAGATRATPSPRRRRPRSRSSSPPPRPARTTRASRAGAPRRFAAAEGLHPTRENQLRQGGGAVQGSERTDHHRALLFPAINGASTSLAKSTGG